MMGRRLSSGIGDPAGRVLVAPPRLYILRAQNDPARLSRTRKPRRRSGWECRQSTKRAGLASAPMPASRATPHPNGSAPLRGSSLDTSPESSVAHELDEPLLHWRYGADASGQRRGADHPQVHPQAHPHHRTHTNTNHHHHVKHPAAAGPHQSAAGAQTALAPSRNFEASETRERPAQALPLRPDRGREQQSARRCPSGDEAGVSAEAVLRTAA